MAYSTATPPSQITQRIGGGFAIWHYNSTDAATVVRAANYITNAQDLGMKKGDWVYQSDLPDPVTDVGGGTVAHMYVVLAVAATGADLSDGTAITLTNT